MSGDPYGTRTRVFAVKGRRPNRWTMGPYSGSTRGTRTLKPDWATDFKSVAYASSAMVPKKWWASWGSNPVPPVYETGALTK